MGLSASGGGDLRNEPVALRPPPSSPCVLARRSASARLPLHPRCPQRLSTSSSSATATVHGDGEEGCAVTILTLSPRAAGKAGVERGALRHAASCPPTDTAADRTHSCGTRSPWLRRKPGPHRRKASCCIVGQYPEPYTPAPGQRGRSFSCTSPYRMCRRALRERRRARWSWWSPGTHMPRVGIVGMLSFPDRGRSPAAP